MLACFSFSMFEGSLFACFGCLLCILFSLCDWFNLAEALPLAEEEASRQKRLRDEEDDVQGGKTTLVLFQEDLAKIQALRFRKLDDLVGAVSEFTKRHGYPKIHMNQKREAAAYYFCSCDPQKKKCFALTFARSSGSKKDAREWFVKSAGPHLCEPNEPRAVALANTWIPDDIKAHMSSLFDLGHGAPEAHKQSTDLASSCGIPTTWEQSDVKALFVVLQKLASDSETIPQLQQLATEGHFVAVDVKEIGGKRILNMAFVATKPMQRLAGLFAFYCTLDSTYGKNKLQLPVQFFVGQTNEGFIVPFAVGFLRAETKANYTWLVETYFKCYKTLPGAFVVDGDVKLREAIEAVAAKYHLAVVVLLCVWHLFNDLEKNLCKKTPGVDVFALKGDFYKLRAISAIDDFDLAWTMFYSTYGSNDSARKYLDQQLFELRQFWVIAWTGSVFGGGLRTTGISESFHSLLASGKSANNSLIDVLQLCDEIMVRQCEKSLRKAAKHEESLEKFKLSDLGGFVVPSVLALLSGHALEKLQESVVSSNFCSVSKLHESELPAWRVSDLRFKGLVHNVFQIEIPFHLSPSVCVVEQLIRDGLSLDADLGKNVCACCRAADFVLGFEQGNGFHLPPRWELLYPGVEERKRLCRALGFNFPKRAQSTNNVTQEGLLDVLTAYRVEFQRQVELGIEIGVASTRARDIMRAHEWEGRKLGVPMYSNDLWIQCGVVGQETAVPEAERRNYCGLWFHAACIGLCRAPKDESERVQCLRCLADRRFRPKVPPIESVAKIAAWDRNGAPRVLANENGGRLRTLNLKCDCGEAVGTGLPCDGMLAVARTEGAVLWFNLFHRHGFSNKLIEFNAPKPVFENNKRFQLDVEEVVNHAGKEDAPSFVPKEMKPKKPTIVAGQKSAEPVLVVTVDGEEKEGNDGLEGVEEGGAKSLRNKSRRFKPKKKKSIDKIDKKKTKN